MKSCKNGQKKIGLGEPTAVLIFHINKDHSEVPLNVYKEMAHRELSKTFRIVSVPIEISVQAEDVALWDVANPEILKELQSNRNISVLRGIFTHMMPSFFPGMLPIQLAYGRNALEHYIGSKLSWVGCLPEVDVSTPIIPLLKRSGNWDGVIALEDLQYIYEYRKETNTRIPIIGKTILRSGEMPLIVAKGGALREIYQKMFRGFATADEFVNALEEETRDNELNFLVFFMDFEVPQINRIDDEPRLDIWKELFQSLAGSAIKFRHFQDPEIQRVILKVAKEERETVINPRAVPKWYHSSDLYEKVENALRLKTDPLTLMRLTISDTFSALHWPETKKTQLELPVKDSDAKVVIRPDLERRIETFNYFYQKAQREVSPPPSDEVTRWYIENLESAHEKVRSCLRS